MQIIHFIVQLLFSKKVGIFPDFSVCMGLSFFRLGLVCLVLGVF